jgi:hypothetical protein
MEEASSFIFRKLRYEKFLTLEVMMHVEHRNVLAFIFGVNKETRTFLIQNMITIQNGFINDGLIEHCISSSDGYNAYDLLDNLYF